MSDTLSTILHKVLDACGIDRFAAYAAATGTAERQLVRLANKSASLLRMVKQTYPRTAGSITMSAALTYNLPTDFYEYVSDTAYVDGNTNPVDWPTSPELWNQLKAGTIATGSILHVRQIGVVLHVHNPLDGDDLLFEYFSKYPIAATATPTVPSKEAFTVDTDVWLLDDDLIFLDLLWRFKKEKGFQDWQADFTEFGLYKKQLIARVTGAKTIGPPKDNSYRPHEPYFNQTA